MKSIMFLSLVIFFSVLPKYSQQTFWRRPAVPTLPSDPNAPVYQKLQNIPSPEVTAQKILANFIGFHQGRAGKRVVVNEDIVIVMDGSGSVGGCEFDEGRKALTQAIEMCEEKGPDFSCRQAAVTFSSGVKRNFNFLPPDQASIKMSAIPYPGGGTNTQAGLAEAEKLFRDPKAGSRLFSRKKVLLLTDGQSNIDKSLTIPNAERLKNIIGVEIFVIAVGSSINGIDEMAKVASYPPDKYVYRVEKNDHLIYVFDLALEKLKKGYKSKPYKSLCSP